MNSEFMGAVVGGWGEVRGLLNSDNSTLVVHFKYDFRHKNVEIYGLRTIKPSLLVLVGQTASGEKIEAVLRLTGPSKVSVVPLLNALLSRRIKVVFYDAKRQLHCLWKLGVEHPVLDLYDLKVAAQCLDLGKNSLDSRHRRNEEELRRHLQTKAKSKKAMDSRLSIAGLFQTYPGSKPEDFDPFPQDPLLGVANRNQTDMRPH